MSGMNELTGHDFLDQPSFRLLADAELADQARKVESSICLVAGCEEVRYLDGGHTWKVCQAHREKFLRSMGVLTDNGFSQMVTDEFKRKMKFGPNESSRPQVIEEISLAETIRKNPRKGFI